MVVASFLVFALVALSGDPLAELRAQPNINRRAIEQRATELHLDQPVPVRWAIWAEGALHGDLGRSVHGEKVSAMLAKSFPVTFRLVFAALGLALVLSLLLGSISAARRYSLFDHAGTVTAFIFLSMPAFWLAGILKNTALQVNQRLGTTVLFFTGERTPGFSGSMLGDISDRVGHLVLPALCLALLVMADWSRFVRASMLDAIESDYVRTARARGLSELRVVGHHALRNALVPFVTVVALGFADLIGGAVIVEQVFSWKGAGFVLLHGLGHNDVYVVSGWLLVAALAVIVLNLVADVAYGIMDPRIRRD